MAEIRYVRGDVTEPQRLNPEELAVIPHCCNNLGVMGAGVALGIKKKWPEAVSAYLHFGAAPGGEGLKNRLGEVFLGLVNNYTVVANMIGQDGVRGHNNERPVKYWALLKAMQETLALAATHLLPQQDIVFHCPKFGSELAGGDWHVIEALIQETWVDRGFNVVVYEFETDRGKWGPIKRKKT